MLALGPWAPVSMPVWANSVAWVGESSEAQGYTGWTLGRGNGRGRPSEACALCSGRAQLPLYVGFLGDLVAAGAGCRGLDPGSYRLCWG